MCGIFWSEESTGHGETAGLIRNRGPTFFAERDYDGIFMMSSVLGIRGFVAQPVVGDCYAFQYNGELYNSEASDTRHIQGIIERAICDESSGCSGCLSHPGQDEHDLAFVRRVYSEINRDENELAISVVRSRKAYFFRDDIGRRSLGISRDPFTLSSVGYDEELDPLRLYVYSFDEKRLFSAFKPAEGLVRLYLERINTICGLISSEKYSGCYQHLVGYESLAKGRGGAACPQPGPGGRATDDFILSFGDSVRMRMPESDPILFFSGGVDSTLVALFAHLQTPPGRPIYLINTAFSGSFDRETGAASHESLRKIFGQRDFIFIKNDLNVELIREHRSRIYGLIRPKTGLMDFNIATVLYFSSMAASGLGSVVLLGSGADEVFGGYSKYRSGPVPFRDHMFFDLFTISSHNISRDDRVISNWGLEARFPFIDSSLVKMALSLHCSWFIRPDGNMENKHLLRSVLRAFGLDQASRVPKKAMQYGAGIKKFEAEINRQH